MASRTYLFFVVFQLYFQSNLLDLTKLNNINPLTNIPRKVFDYVQLETSCSVVGGYDVSEIIKFWIVLIGHYLDLKKENIWEFELVNND